MQPIVARYARSGSDWVVVVSGEGKALSATASGIVQARGLADQLVAKIVSKPRKDLIVVHLLNDSALEFTRAYLTARLAGTETTQPTASERRSGRRRKPAGNTEDPSEPSASTPEQHRETGDDANGADPAGDAPTDPAPNTKTSASNLHQPGSSTRSDQASRPEIPHPAGDHRPP